MPTTAKTATSICWVSESTTGRCTTNPRDSEVPTTPSASPECWHPMPRRKHHYGNSHLLVQRSCWFSKKKYSITVMYVQYTVHTALIQSYCAIKFFPVHVCVLCNFDSTWSTVLFAHLCDLFSSSLTLWHFTFENNYFFKEPYLYTLYIIPTLAIVIYHYHKTGLFAMHNNY